MRLHASPLFLAIALALPVPAGHAQDVSAGIQAQLDRLNAQVAQQQSELTQLRQQLRQVELAQQRGRGLQEPATAPTALAAQSAAPATAPALPAAAVAQQTDPAAPVQQIGEVQREDDEARRAQDKALVVREHAPLFERKFTFDAGFSYSYYDRRQLALSGFLALDAIFLGTINLDQAKATTYTIDLTGRFGVTDRLSLEASVPYVYRDSRFVSGGAGGAASQISEANLSSNGIGDASIAAYYQFVKETARWPDIVGSVRVRGPSGRDPFGLKLIQANDDNTNLILPEDLPTGTGLWSATANVSVLRSYDPVILFGNLGYTYSKPEDFDDISPVLNQVSPAEVALGHTLQLSGGLAIALNDRSAVSFSVSSALQAATHTRAPGGEELRVPGSSSNSTAFNIGGTYTLPSGWIFNGQLAAGLTPDAPNFVFGLHASRMY
ncbi:hypothetical protein ACFOLC_15115 [Lysobacter cavernae]|uniref:Transporter n=1 Tax=Lysobacter cavernae TaxID=1685901 RepID=A0ABV7RRV9_9GAMM